MIGIIAHIIEYCKYKVLQLYYKLIVYFAQNMLHNINDINRKD